MLLQKWRSPEDDAAAMEYILMIVSTGSRWHDVSIHATGTFGTSIAVYLHALWHALPCVPPALHCSCDQTSKQEA